MRNYYNHARFHVHAAYHHLIHAFFPFCTHLADGPAPKSGKYPG